jgi:4-amino-4-deoxy-L-arabinose transferase-like glycosyltransferase
VSWPPHSPSRSPSPSPAGPFAERSLNRLAWSWRHGSAGHGGRAARRFRLLVLAGLATGLWLLFFHGLGARDLWSSHEARAGMDAQTILADGDWLMPRLFDGQPELQKPPLYYWLVACLGWLRGGTVDALAVRLPAAMAALGCVLLLGGWLPFARRWTGTSGSPAPANSGVRAGLLAAAVLATSLHFTWLARLGRIDMPLTLTVTVAILAFTTARQAGPCLLDRVKNGLLGRPLVLRLSGYLALAAGLLLKGPIGVVLPVAVLLLHALSEGRLAAPWRAAFWRGARQHGVFWGVPLVLALTVPWFVAAHVRTAGEFTRVFFGQHNFERALGGPRLRGHPWWAYGPMFAGDFLPWTPALLAALVWCWWRCERRPPMPGASNPILDPEARLGFCWLVAVLGVLSCAGFKRSDYLLPAYPGAALFLGCLLHRWLAAPRGWPHPHVRLALLLLVVLGTVAGWVVRVDWWLPRNEGFRDYRAFAARVRQVSPAPLPVVFFRTEAHALAFHVGRPIEVLVQWEELRDRLRGAATCTLVMPPEEARRCPRLLPGVRMTPILQNTVLAGGQHERPLVLLQATPGGP